MSIAKKKKGYDNSSVLVNNKTKSLKNTKEIDDIFPV